MLGVQPNETFFFLKNLSTIYIFILTTLVKEKILFKEIKFISPAGKNMSTFHGVLITER